MSDPSPRGRLFGAVLVFVAAAAALGYTQSRFALHTDDAYITYRYAQNIADGNGFVYNAGEQVLGTTTPLYTLLLAGAGRLGADIPTASAVLNVCSGAGTLALLFWWLGGLPGGILSGVAGCLILFSFSEFVQYSISGMETSLYELLIVLTFLLYGRGRFVLAAIVAALCALVRLDGAAVGAALFVHYLIAERRLPGWGVVLGYALTLLPWVAFAVAYFGDVRPQSMLAKNTHELAANRYWMLQFLMHPETMMLSTLTMLGVGSAFFLGKRGRGIGGIALWVAMYATAYTLYRIDLYRWYLAPLTVGLSALAGHGLGAVLAGMRARAEEEASRWHGVLATGVLLLVLAPVLVPRMMVVQRVVDGAVVWTDHLERSRADVAALVRERGTPEDIVATGAIGIVGWDTQMYIFDVLGLVTRDAVGYPTEELLEREEARWYISEVETGSTTPEVPNYRFVQHFAGESSPVTFLLYERDPEGWARREALRKQYQFDAENGLQIRGCLLEEQVLSIDLGVEEPLEARYKLFVHAYDAEEKLLGAFDAYPSTPTNKMKPEKAYVERVEVPLELPEGATIHLGFFREDLPDLPRARSSEGEDHLEIPGSVSLASSDG